MHYLAQRIEELPVVLLVALRPRDPAAAHALRDRLLAHPTALVIEPPRLSPDAVEDIVRDRLPEAEPDFCIACVAATDGNPLLVRELLATLVHDGVEPTSENAAAVLGQEAPLRHAAVSRASRSRAPPRQPDLLAAADVLRPGEPLAFVNREIAEDLFVTVKAAQWHLRNIYRKLHVSCRARWASRASRAEGCASGGPDQATWAAPPLGACVGVTVMTG